MKTRVLDSWAILEWISGRQPATDTVAGLQNPKRAQPACR